MAIPDSLQWEIDRTPRNRRLLTGRASVDLPSTASNPGPRSSQTRADPKWGPEQCPQRVSVHVDSCCDLATPRCYNGIASSKVVLSTVQTGPPNSLASFSFAYNRLVSIPSTGTYSTPATGGVEMVSAQSHHNLEQVTYLCRHRPPGGALHRGGHLLRPLPDVPWPVCEC